MTKEEIVDSLEMYTIGRPLKSQVFITVKELQGFIDAIEALEEKPCEDCISRQAVLSKIKEVCFSKEWIQFRVDKGSNGQRDFLINYIEQLPSATPKPKTGRWIDGKCNRCGTHAPFLAMASTYYCSNYCPHCGAKMAESEDK